MASVSRVNLTTHTRTHTQQDMAFSPGKVERENVRGIGDFVGIALFFDSLCFSVRIHRFLLKSVPSKHNENKIKNQIKTWQTQQTRLMRAQVWHITSSSLEMLYLPQSHRSKSWISRDTRKREKSAPKPTICRRPKLDLDKMILAISTPTIRRSATTIHLPHCPNLRIPRGH